MIAQILKLFFAGGFVAAGALRAALSSVGWLDHHGARLPLPNILTQDTTALVVCAATGLIVAATSMKSYSHDIRSRRIHRV